MGSIGFPVMRFPSPRRPIFSKRAAFLVLALATLVLADVSTRTADPQRYLNDVKDLSAPRMEGRGAGTKGIERAAHLIEQRYKGLGLKPAGTNGFFQPFAVITGARLKGNNHFSVQTANGKKELKIDQDFVPLSFSSSASIT